MLVGDEGEAELRSEPGDRLVIVEDDESDRSGAKPQRKLLIQEFVKNWVFVLFR